MIDTLASFIQEHTIGIVSGVLVTSLISIIAINHLIKKSKKATPPSLDDEDEETKDIINKSITLYNKAKKDSKEISELTNEISSANIELDWRILAFIKKKTNEHFENLERLGTKLSITEKEKYMCQVLDTLYKKITDTFKTIDDSPTTLELRNCIINNTYFWVKTMYSTNNTRSNSLEYIISRANACSEDSIYPFVRFLEILELNNIKLNNSQIESLLTAVQSIDFKDKTAGINQVIQHFINSSTTGITQRKIKEIMNLEYVVPYIRYNLLFNKDKTQFMLGEVYKEFKLDNSLNEKLIATQDRVTSLTKNYFENIQIQNTEDIENVKQNLTFLDYVIIPAKFIGNTIYRFLENLF